MKSSVLHNSLGPTAFTLLLAASRLSAATHYVSQDSINPTPPYTNWITAAKNIQLAVLVAAAGDVIIVTNGLYLGGVSVTNALALLSLNGPQFTTIDGGGTNRCVSLTNSASLSGFTLTNGVASSDYGGRGGGVWCSSTNALLTNCVLTGNSVVSFGHFSYGGYGAGAYGGTLYNCTLTGNSAEGGTGGGAYGGTLYNCTLTGNSAEGSTGGGAENSTLFNCTLRGNYGSGAENSTLYNCTLKGNYGSGAANSTLYNCVLSGNSTPYVGGGAAYSTLYNCTLTGNSASWGGGALNCTLYNCIVYFNTGATGANYDSYSTLNHCCTTPLPPGGRGNIALDPQLASARHLSADSPCRGAGSAAYATGTDIDGEPWGNPPSIGCDEYHTGHVTGPLTVSLLANYTNVPVGYPVALTALIEGRATDSVWDFGDGDAAINEPYITHSWMGPGEYLVALWAFNESQLGGVSATVTIHVVALPVLYVAATNINPRPPYATWATAATNIQDAVNAAVLPGALVLVTNGVYPGGVAVTNPLALLSINGPQFTVINGGAPCVSLTGGASLTGFTLTHGGGGVSCTSPNAFLTNCVITGNAGGAYLSTLYNCTLTGNSTPADGGGASDSTLYNCTLSGNKASAGGGASGCTLYNCALTGNSAEGGAGGGAIECTLYNCTLTGNSAPGNYGGGARVCMLYNCIAYFNTASVGPNYDSYSTLNYCCTTPDPGGVGNITKAPLFVDYTHGNLRLQSNCPCINAGNNAYVTTTTDLDGNPRIVNGTVDIGAYEYQGAGSVISYAWLQQYGLPTDGSVDYADPDHDGLNNWQEWVCGTNPTNTLSVLRMVSAVPTTTNTTVTWQSVAGVNYFLERSANPAAPFTLLARNIAGQASTTRYGDTNAAGAGPVFYRVGVMTP